jgi:hypothetical protein
VSCQLYNHSLIHRSTYTLVPSIFVNADFIYCGLTLISGRDRLSAVLHMAERLLGPRTRCVYKEIINPSTAQSFLACSLHENELERSQTVNCIIKLYCWWRSSCTHIPYTMELWPSRSCFWYWAHQVNNGSVQPRRSCSGRC